jgi:hypothetical protein
METLLSSVIAATVTLYFVRRHVKSLPSSKPNIRPRPPKPDSSESGEPTRTHRSLTRGAM